jgi:hypothetical protein
LLLKSRGEWRLSTSVRTAFLEGALHTLRKEGMSMTKKTWLKVAGALAVTSLATMAIAADHLDSPAVKGAETPSDINDVYSFVDGDSVALVMTVFPGAVAADSKFSDKTQYIFHTTSGESFGETKSTLDIVCTFDAGQMVTCVAGEGAGKPVLDKVSGDAHGDAGLESTNKMFTAFTGLRKDPFFFNLDGFKNAVATVTAAAPNLQKDAAGCPTVDAATSTLLVNQLKSSPTAGPPEDFFAPLNGLAIVLKIKKPLINGGGPILSVWASTNKVK